MLRTALLATALSLLLLPSAHAQWKWKDANGNVQYSDLPPPPGTADKDILQRPFVAKQAVVISSPAAPASAASAAVAPKPAASKPTELVEQRRRADEEKAAKAKEEQEKQRIAEQRRDNCSRAQETLRGLQSGQRVSRTNAQGERTFLDENQTAAEMQRARSVIASECK